jgi:predicted MFS family arabinose efflux permease
MTDPTTEPPPRPARPGQGIMLLSAASFAASATIRIADPLLPQIAEDFSTSVAAASVVATTYALAYGAFQLVHGPLGDRFGKIRVITIMTLCAGVTTGLAALAGNLGTLLALRLLSGACAAAIIPLSMAHIGDTVAYDRRQEVLARYLSGVVLGIIAGQAFGGILGDWIGWRGVFIALSGVYAVVIVLLRLRLRPTAPPAASRPLTPSILFGNVEELARRASVRLVVGTVFLEGFLFYGTFTYVGAFLRNVYRLDYTTIGVLLGGFGLGALAYTLLARVIVSRLGQSRMALASGIVLAIAFLSFTVEMPVWALGLPIFLCGLGFYLIHNTLQTRATQMAPEARGLAVSVFASCFFLGQSAGVTVAGQMVMAVGYRPLFVSAAVLLPALALLFARRLRQADDGK